MNIAWEYCINFWNVFSAMAPWLLLGYFLAGVIAFLLPPEQIKRHLNGKGMKPILKAVLLGIPLPLCSCGVIPVAASLREEGAGKGATGAFFISTPQTGIDNILVTWSMVGWHLALLRPVLALLSGLTGGWLIRKPLLLPQNGKRNAVAAAEGKHLPETGKSFLLTASAKCSAVPLPRYCSALPLRH